MKKLSTLTLILIGLLVGLIWQSQPLINQSLDNLTNLVVSPSPNPSVSLLPGQAEVTRVVDGDTIEVRLADGQAAKVRLIGIDTPETVDPNRGKQCFGPEASAETKSLLMGKTILLEKDVSETDKYDRLLRYVYLPLLDGQQLFVNDYLVRQGFAQISTYPPDVKHAEQFLEAQRQAQQSKLGLWGRCQ